MEKVKIILVDDNSVFRDALKTFIMKNEHLEVVAEASNGKEFLELIKTRNPDVVLMDFKMPVMNGIDATKKALQYDANLKIIGLSAFGEYEILVAMAEAGTCGFLPKETVCDNLEVAVKNVFNGKHFFQINHRNIKF